MLIKILLYSLLLLSSSLAARSLAAVDIQVRVANPFSDRISITNRLSEATGSALSIQGTAGEYEPLSFIITTKKSIPKLHITASDLTATNGNISKHHIDIKYLQYWYQAGGAWDSHRVNKQKKQMLVPELLVNDSELIKTDFRKSINTIKTKNHGYITLAGTQTRKRLPLKDYQILDADRLLPIAIEKEKPEQFLLTVKIPEDAFPGNYTGILSFYDGISTTSLPLSVKVLPFKLEQSPLLYSLYYRGQLSDVGPVISSEQKTAKQLEIELTDIVEHGVCCPTLYQRYYPKKATQKPHSLIRRYKQHLEIRTKSGVDNANLYYLGLIAGGPASLKNLHRLRWKAKTLLDASKPFGVEKVYFYGAEERSAAEYEAQKPAWNAIRDIGGGIFVAMDDRYFKQKHPLPPDFMVYHDEISYRNAAKAHGVGSKILSYANPQAGVENPVPFRENYGFKLLKNNFDGAMVYAYQDSMGMMWDDSDHKYYRDHAFTYPTTNGIVSTLAWEAFREAIDDTRYYQTYLKRYDSLQQGTHKKQLVPPVELLKRNLQPQQLRESIIEQMKLLIAGRADR